MAYKYGKGKEERRKKVSQEGFIREISASKHRFCGNLDRFSEPGNLGAASHLASSGAQTKMVGLSTTTSQDSSWIDIIVC